MLHTIPDKIRKIAVAFNFRIKILGPKLPEYLLCHPKCEYLEQSKKCILFKKDLEPGPKRSKECVSAVEGLI